ncbi:MAG: histidine phosphatase family protein [Silicimonas sp.]|nr:histidine phosphatase family protein [Silicimonas sp.]
MGDIVLVRHGQANTHATTEEDYDRLSDLGHQQAAWVGAWMRDHAYEFDHILSGTLRRHRETAAGMKIEAEEDARLNEIEYYTLSHSLLAIKGEPLPSHDTYPDHMPKVFEAWAAAEIEGAETYENFETRIRDLLREAAQPGRRVLCVTSGGVIGMVLRHLLDLDLRAMSDVMLPIWNTSIHRLHVGPDARPVLSGFNAIPHLEHPERAHARTHV